jgi:FAD/FMN-containing dehydrogenase
MADLSINTIAGQKTMLDLSNVDALRAALRGRVVLAGDPDYDEIRKIWNGMIDRLPAIIARCQGVEDIIQSVNFARTNNLLVAVRGGGHNVAGNALCDGGMVIDLSLMRSVWVDPATKRARVAPGATLGDFDHEVQAFGLATPVGINSTTGIAGLTLGGGFGWLSRKYGLTIDNLVSADMVLASGEFVRASESENSDLFWGIRGGGGNFGIVTSFEFQLHEVGPQVLAGPIFYPFDNAEDVLKRYRDVVATTPEELSVWGVLRKAPPLPFLPPDIHGKEIVIFPMLYSGDVAAGQQAIAPLRTLGTPIAEAIMPVPYKGFQSAFDPMMGPGGRNYWKSHNFMTLSDEVIEVLTTFVRKLPTPQCDVALAHLGGAVSRVAPDATAYEQRKAPFLVSIHGRWDDPNDDARCIGWVREFFEALTPYATGGVYVNFMSSDEDVRVHSCYGANYDRLKELKKKYDPANFFRMNQNIACES